MKTTYRITLGIPDGCTLIGCKTEGDAAVVLFEDNRPPQVRPIGCVQEHSGECNDDFNDRSDRCHTQPTPGNDRNPERKLDKSCV